ncbi:LicD family protein [Pasteurella atlantica]|uniref:LicD family protein n=1 Tax=Pasteurellaceae TaxID=712 RepID=UPI002757DD74|nr:LicD family protein [Pasteurella atlantica]MDP8098751.1 LicD family protein [Pasteurella atlantica]MDP8106863.1 LicD family protein [Pasteurella atlantica]MDP8116553.1 LicD family protein [Pasteurella atlantica]
MGAYLVKENNVEYYKINGLEILQNEMSHLLQVVANICNENNLPYWLDSGTLIGSVRHKGFIPWDDDIDISLLKSDYLLLLDKLEEFCSTNNDYFVYFDKNEDGHFCNFFSSSKPIFQRASGSFTPNTIKLDIRPVNLVNNDIQSIDDNKKYRDLANFYIFNKTYFYDANELKEFFKGDRKDFFDFYNLQYGLDAENPILSHPYFEYSTKGFLSYEDIFPLRKCEFSGVGVYIPNKTEDILTSIYGDYMEMPPLEERKPVAIEIIELKKGSAEVVFKNRKSQKGKVSKVISFIKCFGLKKFIEVLKEK